MKRGQPEILGANELNKLLKELPDELSNAALQDIFMSGAKTYKDQMQANAPVGSDNIYKNIKIKKDRRDRTAVLIGVTNKAFHSLFIEFGTVIRKTSGRGPVQYKSASRGAITPKPFIQPAIESATPRAKNQIFDLAGKRISSFLKRKTKSINRKIKSDK